MIDYNARIDVRRMKDDNDIYTRTRTTSRLLHLRVSIRALRVYVYNIQCVHYKRESRLERGGALSFSVDCTLHTAPVNF
jgi:hypothetical protein